MNRISRRSAAEEAESLLEVGRTEPVLDYDVELGLARHHDWIRSDAPVPDWASASVGTTATSWAPVVIKTLVSAVLVGTLAVGAWRARDREQPSAAGDRSPASEEEMAPIPVPVQAPPGDEREAAARQRPGATGTPAVVDSEAAPARRSARADAHDKRTTRQRAHRDQLSARTASDHEAPAVPEPDTEARQSGNDSRFPAAVARANVPAGATRARVEPAASATPAPSEDVSVKRATREVAAVSRPQAPDDLLEMQQVASAEQLLERAPERALTLVRQGDRRFARGYFQQERAYIAIMALIRLDRVDEARTLAASFARQFPALPYGARIRSALEARKPAAVGGASLRR